MNKIAFLSANYILSIPHVLTYLIPTTMDEVGDITILTNEVIKV